MPFIKIKKLHTKLLWLFAEMMMRVITMVIVRLPLLRPSLLLAQQTGANFVVCLGGKSQAIAHPEIKIVMIYCGNISLAYMYMV